MENCSIEIRAGHVRPSSEGGFGFEPTVVSGAEMVQMLKDCNLPCAAAAPPRRHRARRLRERRQRTAPATRFVRRYIIYTTEYHGIDGFGPSGNRHIQLFKNKHFFAAQGAASAAPVQ